LIGIQVGLIFYVNLSVPGHRAVDNEVRWAWYVGQIVVLFLGLIPTSSATEDERSKTLDFRGGEEEDAAIVDYEYAVTRHGRWVGFRLVAARRVHRLWGVVAIEMADRRYLCVPRALFPSKEDWREVEAWLSSSS
ncbi:MAG TPA: hypothetical protein VN108_10020, partial [Marmoricola sp.]|nr:hypothetical protein [Marmoricola sp.]